MNCLRKISICLIFSLSILLISPVIINAKTNENLTKEKISKEEYDKLPLNTVIGYTDGMPFTKEQVDKNGRVKINNTLNENKKIISIEDIKDNINDDGSTKFIDGIPQISNSTIMPYAILQNESWYHEASICSYLVNVPRFSQTTYDLYLTAESARKLANKFDTTNTEMIATFLASFIPYTGGASLIILLKQLNRGEIANNIRGIANYGKHIKFRIIENSYGTFYAVWEWDGSTLEYRVSNTEKIKYTQLLTPYMYYPGYYIQYGSSGNNVVKVQKRLNELGYNSGTADGIFGNNTKNAVIRFQKNKNLDADGIIGPSTWKSLFNDRT